MASAMVEISIRTDMVDVVAGPDVCVLTFKDVNVERRIDCSNFSEGIPRLEKNDLKPKQQEPLSTRYPAEVYVLKDLMYPGKDDEFYLKEAIKVWRKASEDQKAQFRVKYRREIEIVSIENELREAIRAGDTGEAESRLNELTECNPEHGTLVPAKAMVKAMDTARPHEPATALTYLDILEREWTPAAKTIFGREAKALLAPFWRTAGQALEGMAFDPEHPDRHASRAYLECGDWEAVICRVQAEAGFENQPLLLERLAEALWGYGQGLQALASWFVLCWLVPDHFKKLIESGHIPDLLFNMVLHNFIFSQDDVKASKRETAKALLAPFWRTAGQALESMAFDAEYPDHHASRAYLECGDWEAVIRVVQSEVGFKNQPVLLGRMAEAHWQDKQDSRQAIEHWFELCWLDQRYFEGLIEGGHIPVSWLVECWDEAMDVDIEPDEPDISVEWFPAWVLLRDSRWAHSIESRGAEVGPQRAFDLVRELMVGDDDQLALRAELRNIHPALFRCYMDEIRAREG